MSDMYQRKVSNRLILSGMLICLALAVGSLRVLTVLQVLKDLSIPVIMFYLLSYFRVLGPGDIKLISLISGFTGTIFATKVMLIAFVIGGIWSLIVLIQNRALRKNMECVINYTFLLIQGEVCPYPMTEREPLTIPFSVCIGFALYGLLLLEYYV